MAYSRAVRVGPWVLVAGCLGVEADGTYASSLTRQTERSLERVDDALRAFDATLEQVVRIRIYTTTISRWAEIAPAIEPRFAATRPANVMVGVAELAHPDSLVEIEVDAWVGEAI